MLRARLGKPVWMLAACLLIAFSFTAGYLLLANHGGPAAERPGDAATPVAASPAPPPTAAVSSVVFRDVAADVPGAPVTSPGPGARGNGPPPPAGAVLGFSFDATVYDLRLSPDQISRLDVDALTKAAATRETFEKALAALGANRVLCRANQSANFGQEEYIQLTNATPYITGCSISATGQTVNTVGFQSIGATFDLIGKDSGAGTITLDIAIQASLILESTTPLTPTVKAPIIRHAQIQQQRSVIPNQPFLLVSADATSLDADGKATACIARIILSPTPNPAPTQPAASPPAALH